MAFLAASMATTSSFVLPASTRPSTRLFVSTSPSSLDKMTVKELKQLLKDANLQERGLMTRLKRKQDLVEYLLEHLPSNEQSDAVNGATADITTAPLPTTTKRQRARPKTPLYMPPATEEADTSKDALFEQLYERYPPLKLTANDTDSSSSTDDYVDFRQVYHPMLRNASLSNMDVVFVGTASCTPGVTRGVSCTALRLNWNRRCLPSSSDGGTITRPEYTQFKGGTWLFDVGECTQVC